MHADLAVWQKLHQAVIAGIVKGFSLPALRKARVELTWQVVLKTQANNPVSTGT
jgi:hypothetical protein